VLAVVVLSLVVYVAGHAKLNDPLAWNPTPSKTQPCGGGAAFSTLPNTAAGSTDMLKGGQSWQFQWQLVAGDGSGPVHVRIDPNYGTTFSVSVGTAGGDSSTIVSGPDPNYIDVLGTYTLKLTIPQGIVCTGGTQGNLCSMQFYTDSGWYACATVTTDSSTANNNSISNANGCVGNQNGVSKFFFCTNSAVGNFALTARFIWTGSSPTLQQPNGFTEMDSICNATWYQNMHSSLVFSNNKNSDGTLNMVCGAAYRRYLCGQMFPACSGTLQSGVEACKSSCYAAIDACGLQASHQNLFDCATNLNYPFGSATATSDSVSTCPPCKGDCALTMAARASRTSFSVVGLFASAALVVLVKIF